MKGLEILKLVACLGTIGVGLVSLFWPQKIQGFTGLTVNGGRGITEIRAIFGALFIALGALPILLGVPEAYRFLGWAYLAIGAVRMVSMLIDNSVEQSNVVSVITEVLFGVVLVL